MLYSFFINYLNYFDKILKKRKKHKNIIMYLFKIKNLLLFKH